MRLFIHSCLCGFLFLETIRLFLCIDKAFSPFKIFFVFIFGFVCKFWSKECFDDLMNC